MREKVKELLNGRSVVFSLTQGKVAEFDMNVFSRFVEMAVQFGATHIDVGELPFRYTWFLPDNSDPYASWCNSSMGLFRVFPPEELQEWIPLDAARELQEVIEAKLAIMRPYGLKGVVSGVEPLWLPEGVYRAHPRWRGAQCELGRIARRPYFAPSIDEPEVLSLYRKAMRQCTERFPEIDQFSFLSNDSGGGISWSPCLYPGMNGPTWWRTRDGGARIADWLKAMQEGAAEAGVKVRINVGASGLPPEMVASARARLAPGLFVNHGNNHNETWGVGGASLSGGLWSASYPVVGLGDPAGFISGLQGVYSNPAGDCERVSVSMDQENMPLGRVLLETYFEEPGQGSVNRARLLLRAAEKVCGSPELAEKLVGVWENVRMAQHAILQVRQQGFGLVIPFCCTSMRWLTRPLVPEPEKLPPEATAHWRKFLFSTGTEEQNLNLCYVLGKAVFSGSSVVWMARWCLQEAINRLKGARRTLGDMAAKTGDGDAAARLSLYAARVGALACLAANARNTIMYQYALDVAAQPQFGPNMMDYDDNITYDQRALRFRKIAREELDNITELVELMESQTETVIACARTPEEENVFLFAPDLVEQLRLKMDVMLDHWQDYENLYPATKVYELEPEPKENILPPTERPLAEGR